MDASADKHSETPEAESRGRDEGGFGHRVIPDIVRRALMTGVGTVLLGQEGVRTALGDMKMPKEAIEFLVSQADRTKREVIHSLARELRQFLDGLELQELIANSLEGTTFEIHTTIRVVQQDDGSMGAKVLDKGGQVRRSRGERAAAKRRSRAPATRDSDDDEGAEGSSKV